ncbi:MAG: hypothetical protein U0234_15795 [Sandaracinus sp.]
MDVTHALTWLAVGLALPGCALDFDALERGRGPAIDASTDASRVDASGRDGGTHPPEDAHVAVDASASSDAGLDAERVGDAAQADDAAVPPADAAVACPVLDCSDPTCLGAPCDDGRACTTNDVCTLAQDCEGTPITCAPMECATVACVEPGGCRAVAALPDATPCSTGRCCYGRCSGLRDSGNCAGCGLGCEEYSCTGTGEPRCLCDTNGGCPPGQTCSGGICRCTAGSQCAAGQQCIGGTCTY